jgi:hypothetical protein
MKRVAEQSHRPCQDRDGQLQRSGDRKPDPADHKSPGWPASALGIISQARKRKAHGRMPNPTYQVHGQNSRCTPARPSLVIRGAVPLPVRFPIPLINPYVRFSRIRLPMIFVTWLRCLRIADRATELVQVAPVEPVLSPQLGLTGARVAVPLRREHRHGLSYCSRWRHGSRPSRRRDLSAVLDRLRVRRGTPGAEVCRRGLASEHSASPAAGRRSTGQLALLTGEPVEQSQARKPATVVPVACHFACSEHRRELPQIFGDADPKCALLLQTAQVDQNTASHRHGSSLRHRRGSDGSHPQPAPQKSGITLLYKAIPDHERRAWDSNPRWV